MSAEGSSSAEVLGSSDGLWGFWMDSGSEVGASGARGWRLWPSSSMGSVSGSSDVCSSTGSALSSSLWVEGSAACDFHGNLFLDGVVQLAGHLFELFDAGELVDVFEAEAKEEVLGGFVEDRAADDLLAAGGGDELAGEQRAEDAGGVDAADLGDLGGGDGLLVGDDGEGFEGLEGEL